MATSHDVIRRGLGLCLVIAAAHFATGARRDTVQSVREVATLRSARAAHTATTLMSGKVLIAGGMPEGGGGIASLEIFDPARNVIEPAGALRTARAGHSATLLKDGRVLIAGGYNGGYVASVEIFDPAAPEKMRVRPAGSLTLGRSDHTATLLGDGRVLMAGGVGDGYTFLSSAELYDPATGRSERVGSLSVARESHTATVLTDGRVLIIGGHTGRRQDMVVYASAELFSPGTRRFEPTGAMVTARHKHDSIGLKDGRVLVIGGADRTDHVYFNSTEIYDTRSGLFSAGPSMLNQRYKIANTSVLLPDGRVLVTSGARSMEILDPSGRSFREVSGALPEAYHFAAAALLSGGDVIITGGYSNAGRNTAGVWRFGN